MSSPVGSEVVVAGAFFMVLVAVLVFAARPGHAVNRTCGALLALQGVSDLMWQGMRESADAHQAYAYAKVANWYLLPIPFLTLLACHFLFPPAGRDRWRAAGLAAVAALSAVCGILFAIRPALFLFDPGSLMPPYFVRPGPLGLLWGGAVNWLAHAFVVVVSARAAVSPARTSIQRKQAGLVGFAFLLLLASEGGSMAMNFFQPTALSNPFKLARDAVGVACLATGMGHLPRLVDPFQGRVRTTMAAFFLLATVSGVLDGARSLLTSWGGPAVLFGTRFLWVSAHAAILAAALVRFGLAGLKAPMQAHVARLSRAAAVVGVTLVPAGGAFMVQSDLPRSLAVALLLCVGLVVLAPLRWGLLGRAASRFLLLDSVAAAGERSFVYRAELARRLRRGPISLEGDPHLDRLRRELGLSREAHALLALVVKGDAGMPPAAEYLGRYRVERELGRGAHATTFLARDLANGGQVVLKRHHPGTSKPTVLREVRALRAIRHPRVVPLLDVEQVDGEMFLALGYVKGGTLQSLLRSGPLAPLAAAELARDIAEGLGAIHGAGFVHGDVKPANVFVDAAGRAVLGDLGCARAAQGRMQGTLTADAPLGSFPTVAPEVLNGATPTARSDLYSVGALLYSLLTGESYVRLEGKGALQAFEAVCGDPPRLPHPAVPASLEGVITRLLAKDPTRRPGSAKELHADLVRACKALRRSQRMAPGPASAAAPRPRRIGQAFA